MAISDKLASFAFIGIKDFVIRDKTTHAVACTLKHMVGLDIEDTTAQDFLKGGLGMDKLLTLYGSRDCKLTGQTATQTTDLIKVMSNTSMVIKTKPQQQIEEPLLIGGKFTLNLVPSAGISPTIYKIDANGKEVKPALVVGSPTTKETDYSIANTKEITCHTSVTKIRVYYDSDIEVETLEMAENVSKNWEGSGLLLVKEIETGALYNAWLDCPNMSVQPSFKLSVANSESAPSPIDLTIDLMKDTAKGYPYAISFKKAE